MSRRSVEASMKKYAKRIERVEEKRTQLICKLIDTPMTKKNRYNTMCRINYYEKLIKTLHNCIEYQTRASRGRN